MYGIFIHSRLALSLGALILLVVLLASTSCSKKQTVIQPAEEYYATAIEFMDKKQYTAAVEQFEELQTFHPLSPYTQISELEKISANYGLGDYGETFYLSRRFIEFYPDSPQLDFAYYMMGRAEYARGVALIDRFNERELKRARASYRTFRQLVEEFPKSNYVIEATAHMRHIRNILARDELKVAQYYFKRFSYVATIDRCINILENFPNTPYNLAALELLEQSYRKLGWDEEADKLASVYSDNANLYDAN